MEKKKSDYGALDSKESKEAYERAGGVKLVDHPLYKKPALRTSVRSILPRMMCLCLVLVIVCVGSGYVMYVQLASGYVPIKPGTTAYSLTHPGMDRMRGHEAGPSLQSMNHLRPALQPYYAHHKASREHMKPKKEWIHAEEKENGHLWKEWCKKMSVGVRRKWCPQYERSVHEEIKRL
ncbi:hypothetical protein GUITHDRAFT_155508, partial [Guillardia theta CCMP2712]